MAGTSSRYVCMQMAAQMKQLEQRLMALRGELRDKESKARQAEGSVQDLKLQLDDLQVCTTALHASQDCALHSVVDLETQLMT